jgi:hypothetical protein
LVQPTDGYEWVKAIPKTNGRTIFEALVRHDQGDNATTTISQANQVIDNLKYTNQYVCSWEVCSAQLKIIRSTWKPWHHYPDGRHPVTH